MCKDPDSLVNPEPAPTKCSGITCVTGMFNFLFFNLDIHFIKNLR